MVESATLLFMLLNPFFMSIYLIALIQTVSGPVFSRVMIRAGLISFAIFCIFALIGDVIFTRVLHVRFASFMLFGGIAFLIIAIQFLLQGAEAMKTLRGDPEYLAGAVAMPFMIGPGTVSASVLIGGKLEIAPGLGAIALAVSACVISVILLKVLHDWIQQRNIGLVQRYVEITGRIMALVTGTIAVEMILTGIEMWWESWS